MLKPLYCALFLALGAFGFASPALAQSAPAAAATNSPTPQASIAPAKPTVVLVPYREPDGTNPYAAPITAGLAKKLNAAGINVTTIAPIDYLDAVANAAKICSENNASSILIPEGRYEQSMKSLYLVYITVVKYPTHAELRLDDVGCNGVVAWSTTATGDQTPSGVNSVSNLGAAVNGAFHAAVRSAVQKFVTTNIVTQNASQVAVASASPAPAQSPSVASATTAATPTTYLLIPFRQPGIADPRDADITHSLLLQLQQRNLNIKVGSPIDHLTAVANAQQLCASNDAQEIIVPDVRIEQSSYTGRSHASMRLALLSCSGTVVNTAFAQADMGVTFLHNFGAAVVGVSERAMIPALNQLFPVEKAVTSGS